MSTPTPTIYWGHYDGPPPAGFLSTTSVLSDVEDDLADPGTFVTYTTTGTNSTLVHQPFEGSVVAIAEYACPVRILDVQATGRCRDIMASPLASTPSGHIALSYWNGTEWVGLGTPESLIAGFYWGTVNAEMTSTVVTRYVRARITGGMSGKGAWTVTTDIADFQIEAVPEAPPTSILWSDQDRPALGSMTPTTLLQDHEPNDTLTGETVYKSVTFTGPYAVRNIEGVLTAVLGWDCPVSLKGLTAAYGRSAPGMMESTCLMPPEITLAGFQFTNALEWSLNGTTWTPLGITSGGGSSGTLSASFSPVTAKYARLVLEASLETYDDFTITRTLSVRLSDFRATAEPLAPSDPPANLRGVGGCEGPQLTWLWDPCGCCVGYEVQVDGGAIEDIGAATTYVLAPVPVPSAHTLKVRGYNCGGVGPWAELALTSCTTDTDPPPDPDPDPNNDGCKCAWAPENSPCAPWEGEIGTPTTSWKKAGCS
ncbi:MAG: hypothetical protein QM758_06795 [Armatimonas sp.]